MFDQSFGAFNETLDFNFAENPTVGWEQNQLTDATATGLEQPTGQDDLFGIAMTDAVYQASWNMSKRPRVSIPTGLPFNQYPEHVEQPQPYYLPQQPQLVSPHQLGFPPTGQYQQPFGANEGLGGWTFNGPQNNTTGTGQQIEWTTIDPQLYGPTLTDDGPLFFPDGAENNNTTGRQRSMSLRSNGSNSMRRKLRSAQDSNSSPPSDHSKQSAKDTNNSPYSEHSKRSSDTTDNERKALRQTRKLAHRGSAYQGPYKPEKPKVREDKPWIRTNATTQGITTRTAKINQYQPVYEDRPHPIGGSWTSPYGNIFEYTSKWELKEKTYSTEQIRDFIFHYPVDKRTHARLKLWIQKTPTDSARRYHSISHAKCRFKDCPAQLYQTGTILHGHYRVAFDERWHAHGSNVDPFYMAGFVHLYCMERFLDFEAVCKLGVVEVDDRVLPLEPKGRFAGSLAGQPEYHIASQFVYEAKNGSLRQNVEEFKNYPVHSQFRRGQEKPHQDTLTYWMHMYKQNTRPQAQIKQFQDRGLKASHIIVNKGNLEVLFRDNLKRKRAAKAEKAARKKRKVREYPIDEEHEKEDEELVQQALAEAKQKTKDKKKKRKTIIVEVTDSSSSDDEESYGNDDSSDDDVKSLCSPVKGFRKSPRLKDKARKVYVNSPKIPGEHLEITPQSYSQGTPQQHLQGTPEQHVRASPYNGYAPVNQEPQFAVDDFGLPTYEYDPNDPDLRDIQQYLQRRSSSLSRQLRRSSRGASFTREITSRASQSQSPKSTRGHRVSIGGATTRVFNTAAAPNEHSRRSSRSTNRIAKPRGVLKQ